MADGHDHPVSRARRGGVVVVRHVAWLRFKDEVDARRIERHDLVDLRVMDIEF